MEDSVAIVGISCRFAGCNSPASLWDAVMSRRSMLTSLGVGCEMPTGQKSVFDRPYPVRLGQLGDLYSCVPAMQTFPRQVNAGENQDLYFATQLAFDALADASMPPRPAVPIRGSVRFGYAPPFNASTVNWLQHTTFLEQTLDIIHRFFQNAPEELLDGVKEKLVESLPAPNAASFLLGSGYRFASWIARQCSFTGAATIMDAGLLSGAATISDAMSDLRCGRADIALAGVMTAPLNRAYLEGLSGEVDFSSESSLQPFSEDACGTIPGEGGAVFVLKRRADALRNHDRIYALLRSVAIGHPPSDAPAAILNEAVERVGVPVKSIALVEADGTGIRASDEREIAMIQSLWGEHRPGGRLVGVGSVKGNIGHTLRASMAAGVVKTALALHHRVLPPQVATDRPLATLAHSASSAYLLGEARPWIVGDAASPRRAVVLGGNFDARDPVGGVCQSGRSAAILLEEEPEVRT